MLTLLPGCPLVLAMAYGKMTTAPSMGITPAIVPLFRWRRQSTQGPSDRSALGNRPFRSWPLTPHRHPPRQGSSQAKRPRAGWS